MDQIYWKIVPRICKIVHKYETNFIAYQVIAAEQLTHENLAFYNKYCDIVKTIPQAQTLSITFGKVVNTSLFQ